MRKSALTRFSARSPSSRRAWIEIPAGRSDSRPLPVALLAEGVDRNTVRNVEGVDLAASPSSRRAWIEMMLVAHSLIVCPGRPPRGGRG